MLQQYHEARHSIRADVLTLVEDLAETNKEGLVALMALDSAKLESLRKPLAVVSERTEKIDNAIVLLFARYTPEARDLREMVSYLKITSTLNRIRTNINNYLKNMQGMLAEESEEIQGFIQSSLSINRCTEDAFESIVEMFKTFEDNEKIKALAAKIDLEYSKTDDIYTLLEKDVLKKVGIAQGQAEEYFNLLKYIRKNLKVIDRLDSVAQRIIFARMGGKL
ncbi:MAG: hypothetical protein GQ531_09730 [Sulfurovum sp.]|nr:hypothetical protein [Sulfurovum sp.]